MTFAIVALTLIANTIIAKRTQIAKKPFHISQLESSRAYLDAGESIGGIVPARNKASALKTLLFALSPALGVRFSPSRRTPPAHAVAAGAAGVRTPTYVTTPIYYVNDVPHIGHAYTSVAADAVARFGRLDGQPTWFATGTDEHGEKVQESALRRNVTPQAFCDDVSMSFQKLKSAFDLSNDVFVRTTGADHKIAVRAMWKRLEDAGLIYKGVYEGWYSIRDECFYKESDLIEVNGEKRAPSGSVVEWRAKEPSYFFKLSEFTKPLLDYYEAHPDVIQPASRRNEILSVLSKDEGLYDLSISRTSFSWGISVPGDEEHVIYVWIDALTNYLTVLGWPESEKTGGDEGPFHTFWPHAMHIVGKDIIRFHTLYWPAMLMGANLPLPKKIFAHGWWTKDGEKISKSLGNVIDPFELIDTYGLDATRYFFLSNVKFGSDADFSHGDMLRVYNGFLANSLGNLLQRTVTLSYKNLDKASPPRPDSNSLLEEDVKILNEARALPKKLQAAYDSLALHDACWAVETVVRNANVYIDEQAPWALRKTDKERFSIVLWTLSEILRITAISFAPIMPGASRKMLLSLGLDESIAANPLLDMVENSLYETNQNALPKPEVLFPKLDEDAILEAEAAKEAAKAKPRITLESGELENLKAEIKTAGDDVRDAKANGMSKEDLAPLIETMLRLKTTYEEATGEPYDPPKQKKKSKKAKEMAS